MKAVIPAAGKGTRLEPITLAIPKELLMVGNKAVIEHVINALKNTGITDITIIVGWRKNAILDYLGSGERLGVNLTYVVQDKREGLARAVLAGHRTINNDPFIVVLGDNFFYPPTFLDTILATHTQQHADATIGVAEIQDPTRHGIIKPGSENTILDIIEKPSKSQAPSNLGCIGVYVFQPEIFHYIKQTKPGKNNEYQLTDSIKLMIQEKKRVVYNQIPGIHIDIGTLEDLQKANTFLHNQHTK